MWILYNSVEQQYTLQNKSCSNQQNETLTFFCNQMFGQKEMVVGDCWLPAVISNTAVTVQHGRWKVWHNWAVFNPKNICIQINLSPCFVIAIEATHNSNLTRKLFEVKTKYFLNVFTSSSRNDDEEKNKSRKTMQKKRWKQS